MLLEPSWLFVICLTYSSSGKPGMGALEAYFCLYDMGEAKAADLPKEKELFLSC